MSLKVDVEEGGEGESAFLGFESELIDQFEREHVDGFVRQVIGGALGGNFSAVDEMCVGCNVRDVDAELEEAVADGFERETVLVVSGVERVNGEDHLSELAVIFNWQIILRLGDVFGV